MKKMIRTSASSVEMCDSHRAEPAARNAQVRNGTSSGVGCVLDEGARRRTLYFSFSSRMMTLLRL